MTTILLVAVLILTVLTLGLVIFQYIKKPKSNLSTVDIIGALEKENEKLRNEISTTQQMQSQNNRIFNEAIFQTITSNNQGLSELLKISREQEIQTLNQLEKRMEQISNANMQISKQVDEKLEKINAENAKQLSEMRATVDEKLNTNLTNRLNESFGLISERLEALYKSFGEIQNLSSGVNDLNKILGNVKVRGTFGEVQLNSLLEQMMATDQYLSNAQIKENSAERVEFAIKLPGKDEKNILLPIDAKFPLEDYSRLLEAKDKKEEQACLKALEARIKTEAKSIKTKYIYPPKTTDFALMYIPLEGLYAEILKMPGLVELLQREYRVIICCPTTLAALLSSLQMGFKTLYIEKRSSEIWSLLASFRREFANFVELLAKTQKKLLEANDSIESATKKTQKIQKQLQNVTTNAPDFLVQEIDNTSKDY